MKKVLQGLLLGFCALLSTPAPLEAQDSLCVSQDSLHLPSHLFARVDTLQMRLWADSVLSSLSLEEQIGQLIMPIIYPSSDSLQIGHVEERMARGHWGGILYQKGLLREQVVMNHRLQRQSRIPLLIALDGEWGLYMRLKDAPRYPRNIGLGRQSNGRLLYDYGREIARQCRLVGIHINFAPDVDVNINPKNPVIGTRSFGEDPQRVASLSLSYALGLEDGGILSVAKHFPGHGDTNEDSHKTLPFVSASRERMQEVELFPFAQYIQAGLGGIMTAHLRVPAYEPEPIPSSLSGRICTQLLREEMGFSGLTFTDGLEMKGVFGGKTVDIGVAALRAGNDILLGPSDPDAMLQSIAEAVRRGDLSADLIRQKCLKVLYYKYRLIISQRDERASAAEIKQLIWTREAEQLQSSLWSASLTAAIRDAKTFEEIERKGYKRVALLEVGKSIAPQSSLKALAASGIRLERIAWPSQTSEQAKVMARLSSYPLVLVHLYSSQGIPTQSLSRLMATTPVVVAYFASPYRLSASAPWLAKSKGFIYAYEAVPEAAEAVVSLLDPAAPAQTRAQSPTRVEDKDDPTAQMPGALPESAKPRREADQRALSKSFGLSHPERIDSLALEGIQEGAYPGCQIFIWHRGRTVYNKAFGTLTGELGSPAVELSTVYDLASVTKAIATTPAVMLLVGQGKLRLEGRVSSYLPEFAHTPVGAIRLRELLLHQSGLAPGINFYTDLIAPDSYEGALLRYRPFDGGIPLVGRAWGNPNFRFDSTFVARRPSPEYPLQMAEGLYLSAHFRDKMIERLAEAEVRRRKRYRYSDLNFLLLQLIVERVSGEPLDQFVQRSLFSPVGAALYYNPLQRGLSRESIAPAQRDSFLRKQIVRGYVDDETAACLGGVGGNAGLFGNASEVGKMCLLLLRQGKWQSKQVIPRSVVRRFTTTSNTEKTRFLGFDRQRPRGTTPTAESASLQTYGHLGFTGTCIWIDPKQELIFVFLSNRTYPSRGNSKIIDLRLRPMLHELAYELVRSR